MDLYQCQQFDFFLQTATERYVERLTQRFRGAEPALKAIMSSSTADDVRVHEFVDAVFEDFLLSNIDGAAFVLRSLSKKRIPLTWTQGHASSTVEETMVRWAKAMFVDLLLQKSLEILQQQASYQPVQLGDS
jgi:hypothetical protein